jgi:hypothetical protein
MSEIKVRVGKPYDGDVVKWISKIAIFGKKGTIPL